MLPEVTDFSLQMPVPNILPYGLIKAVHAFTIVFSFISALYISTLKLLTKSDQISKYLEVNLLYFSSIRYVP